MAAAEKTDTVPWPQSVTAGNIGKGRNPIGHVRREKDPEAVLGRHGR